MNTTQLLTVTIVSLLAVMSPGPDFVIVTRNSLLYSKRVGLATALGIALGTTVWIALSLIGVSLILSQVAIAFTVIKYAGAAYLVWIGWKSICAKPMNFEGAGTKEREMSARSAFKIGFWTNILNAKAALFFISFFSVVLPADASIAFRILCGAEISLIALVWFSLVATVLSVGFIKRFFQKIAVWIERACGVALVMFGVKLADAD